MAHDKRIVLAHRFTLLAGDVILFIDEVHTLVQSGTTGRGNKGSGFDIANLLKPSLGRGQFQVIGCPVISSASFLCSK